jgi:hypothetical protein
MRPRVLLAGAVASLLSACDGCRTTTPTTTTEPATGSITTIDAPAAAVDGDPVVGARRGMGWYPNIEVDDDNQLHMAWVDADAGDVRYAVTVAAGSALAEPPVPVDALGAVGSFLRLALGPGGVPMLAYSRQDTGIFRFAWRPVDRERAGAAGAVVDAAPFPELPPQTTSGGPVGLLSGFVGEEVGYGEQVGRAGGHRLLQRRRSLTARPSSRGCGGVFGRQRRRPRKARP